MRRGIVLQVNAIDRDVWRAEIVLLAADGFGTNVIMRRTGEARMAVWHRQQRFMQAGMDGLLRDAKVASRSW